MLLSPMLTREPILLPFPSFNLWLRFFPEVTARIVAPCAT
jgi:hypothetical protein